GNTDTLRIVLPCGADLQIMIQFYQQFVLNGETVFSPNLYGSDPSRKKNTSLNPKFGPQLFGCVDTPLQNILFCLGYVF
ncbi:MAG: hypothetical protein MUP18_01970, partial [Desulfobacterales bacterium]|nr:hypothetical protein [Desulfobacterales bacterium]